MYFQLFVTGSSLRKNELPLSSSMVIKNDTQSELPNNRSRSQLPAPRVLAAPIRKVSAHATPLLPDVRFYCYSSHKKRTNDCLVFCIA